MKNNSGIKFQLISEIVNDPYSSTSKGYQQAAHIADFEQIMAVYKQHGYFKGEQSMPGAQ